MEHFLAPLQCVCEATSTGESFLARLEESWWDLVVVDLHIPGWNAIRSLATQAPLKSNLLFVTGYPEAFCLSVPENERVWRSYFQRGNADILYKPFDRREFLCKVVQLLGDTAAMFPFTELQLQTIREVRMVLARCWVDLGPIFIQMPEAGVVELSGLLRPLPDASMTAGNGLVERVVGDIGALDDVQDIRITAEVEEEVTGELMQL